MIIRLLHIQRLLLAFVSVCCCLVVGSRISPSLDRRWFVKRENGWLQISFPQKATRQTQTTSSSPSLSFVRGGSSSSSSSSIASATANSPIVDGKSDTTTTTTTTTSEIDPSSTQQQQQQQQQLSSLEGNQHTATLSTASSFNEDNNTTNDARQETDTNTTAASTYANDTVLQLLPKWKQRLPHQLQRRRTLHRILIPHNKDRITKNEEDYIHVYLLGTSHVSNDSCTDVKLLLDAVEPNVVFLELCSQRVGMLEELPKFDNNEEKEETEKVIDNDNNGDEVKKKKKKKKTSSSSFWKKVHDMQHNSPDKSMSKGSAISTVLLTQVQEDYAKKLGVDIGSEFRVAYQWCTNTTTSSSSSSTSSSRPKRLPQTLILGDRPLQLTLLRAWESLKFFGKTKLIISLILSSIFSPSSKEIREWMLKILEDDKTDVLTESIEEMKKHFPTLQNVIINERDAYMSCKIYQTCSLLSNYHHTHNRHHNSNSNNTNSNDNISKMVVIVGAGHCPGIINWLTNSNNKNPIDVLKKIIKTKKYNSLDDLSSVIHDVTELPLY